MPDYVQLAGRATNTDPLRNFRFRVEIHHTLPGFYSDINFAKLGFMQVSGISTQTEIISYREGGDNTTPRVMPGQSGFAPLSLTRGLLVGGGGSDTPQDTKLALWQWYRQIFAVQEGGSQSGSGITPTQNTDFRTDVYLRVYEHPVTGPPGTGWLPAKPRAAFKFFNCWPQALAFSDLDAGGNGIMVQNLTLAHEGFDVRTADYAETGVTW